MQALRDASDLDHCFCHVRIILSSFVHAEHGGRHSRRYRRSGRGRANVDIHIPGMKPSVSKYLENLQTEPDVKLMNDYPVVVKGKDQQLEAAVAELMKLIR